LYQVDRTTVYRWYVRYKERQNFDDLQRKIGSGRPKILDDETLSCLFDIVLNPASRFGFETDLWTSRRIIQVLEKEFTIKISQSTMWRMLRELDLTYQKPERRYFQANETLRKEWLKKDLPKIMSIVKKHRAILYFEDEANISLTPVLGRTWAIKGETPIQIVTGNRSSVSAMSAISKRGSLVFTLHEKRIASEEVIRFLDQLLIHHPRRHIVVVMDQAKPHTSKKTKEFIESKKRLAHGA
jgi:transposase